MHRPRTVSPYSPQFDKSCVSVNWSIRAAPRLVCGQFALPTVKSSGPAAPATNEAAASNIAVPLTQRLSIELSAPKKDALICDYCTRAGIGAAIGQAMEMIPLLKNRRFDPELVDSMSEAYASVCQTLGLNTKSDRATKTVAPKIIELATRGVRSPIVIYTLAIEELRNDH